ncbi:MAG: outer membrane protein assembly factor BamA [Bacteroidales bacterium]|nr:outer membrane protein assembly factor BamA [Bacteroidales bacterium]MCF8327654.1 outer membrane protein assembly factor BamA [Bacteroidales bacterium]
MRIAKGISLITVLLIIPFLSVSQVSIGDNLAKIDYSNPRTYTVGGITVEGTKNLDHSVLIMLSGISVGDKIEVPGEKITKALENLWDQGLFEDIEINATKIQGSKIFLEYKFKERPRLSKFAIKGVRKSEATDLREKLKLVRGDVLTDHTLNRSRTIIKDYFIDKGFLKAEVNFKQKTDSASSNSIILDIEIDKNDKVKINEINFIGNHHLSDNELKRTFKETKEKNFFRFWKASKFIREDFEEDKKKILTKYNNLGFRDAQIIEDTVYNYDENTINIDLKIKEGDRYYFRNISWEGNTVYTDEELSRVLAIQKGDIYNQSRLDANLYMNMEGPDVSSLYLDDGYLFFNVDPVEVNVENDSIDLEIRIYEGQQAVVRSISVSGNTRTKDYVILREVRSKPGELFNRSDIIRTQRELAQLEYFDPEKLDVKPKPNPEDGTVDIEYIVEETSTDKFELSGGWGLGRIVGTIGVSFNNFSLSNIFDKEAWNPIPHGDGQRLSIRGQSNGVYYQSYNMSFTEPWLGGKKPNAFSVSVYHSVQSNGVPKGDEGRQSIRINGASVSLGKRLKFPDDYFSLYQSLTYQNYKLNNYYSTFSFSSGNSNNLSYTLELARNSVDQPIFPRKGSELSLSVQMTPPYSLIEGKDYKDAPPAEKFKWVEYHKWKFKSSWYTSLAGDLVASMRTKFGFLGLYNRDMGIAPFERFYLGGDGLSGYALDGRELIGMRGYANQTLTPKGDKGNYIGGTIFNKYTFELRYPVSLNPQATIYVLGFVEAGDTWMKFKEFQPFNVKRSAGLGLRIRLPMFGLLGLDWGYGFDNIPGNPGANGAQFHFSINNSIE